jgi:MYXO-CTERM domain-containing protein
MDAAATEDAPATPEPHPEAGTGPLKPADDSGCGCALANRSFAPGSLAALGLAALGLSRARRRRR